MRLIGEQPNTIWKFALPIEDEFTLVMPAGSLPLSVGVQAGQPVLWAAVYSGAGSEERHRFSLRGTGHPMPGLLLRRFVGTFQLEALGLVYHLFDGGPENERA